MKNSRLSMFLWSFLGCFLFSLAIGYGNGFGQATLRLFPPIIGGYQSGDNFNIDIFVDTGGQKVVAVAAYIQYNPTYFQAVSINMAGSIFTTFFESTIDSNKGLIKIGAGIPTPGVNTANGKVASVNLTALSNIGPGTCSISLVLTPGYDSDSAVFLGDGSGTNILRTVYNVRCETTLEVNIDIEPWFKPNIIDWKFKWAPILVAILSKPTFDAPKMIDRASLTFGHNGDEKSLAFCSPLAIDVSGDKARDLVCLFYTGKTGFLCGDTEGILQGKTKDGTPFEGSDSVKIVPCK